LTLRRARATTYVVVALLVAVALRFTPRIPDRRPAELLQQGAPDSTVVAAAPPEVQLHDTLGQGETLNLLLRRGGIADSEVVHVIRAANTLDPRRVPAGMPVTFTAVARDSSPNEIVLQLAVDRLLKLQRTDSGWTGTEVQLPWTTDTVVVAGAIESTLYEAMDKAAERLLPVGARRQLTWGLADIYEYRVDMSRDLQVGDRFRVMAERSVSSTGVVRIDRILAASFELSGDAIEAIRFKSKSVAGDFFDQNGRSLRAAFLRAPVQFRRISSVFSMRKHPILGYVRAHKGTDYAANAGTPVRAIGDGVVTRAGWSNGYGNLLEIRHPNGYVTRYGHMRAFAKGVRAGTHVTIGQTVGYVGMTGLATGPHLHFEVLVKGVQRDPRIALKLKGGQPIPSSELATFQLERQRMIASLDNASTGVVNLAMR
jgi:murein DD-endopeptidase MepM/ murein hydrolase activator NlpD